MFNPISYSQQAFVDYFNTQPCEVKGTANAGTEFYKRMLYNILYSTLKFTIPKEWALNYFRFWLLHYGSIGVIYTKEFGWVAQPYSIVKLNLYYNPKIIEIYNAFIKTPKVGVIGVNAEIVKCFDDFYGFDDIVARYAEKLANCDKSVDVSLMNSNITYSAEVENKKQAEEVKTAYGKATTGEPLVVINKDILGDKKIGTMFPNVKNNFIAPDVLSAKHTILNEFLTFIGIKNANYEKKERLNSQEVDQNNDLTSAIITVVKNNIQACFDSINSFADLGLKVELNYNYIESINKEGVSFDE